MKKIIEFVNESRPVGSKNKKKAEAEDYSDVKAGVDAEDNTTGGLWAIDEPKDDEPVEPLDKAKLNKNMKNLLMKFKTEEDFFIVGEAGWGKTSIIKNMAKRFHRKVITVYLDKAVASDLGGIPVPVKGKSGAVQQMAMPAWAKLIEDNPDEKFLLFFDEMNQAQPDVMNALMPIVLEHEICGRKFENFFVGAAGNFERENGAVNALSGPLASRFKPLIEWESGTPEAWEQAFEFITKKWGKTDEAKDFINIFKDNCNLFVNPREVEQKIIKWAIKLKQYAIDNADDDNSEFESSDFLRRLEGLSKDDLTRTDKAQLAEMADVMYDFINAKQTEKRGRSADKNRDMLTPDFLKTIKYGMTNGYIPGQDGDTRKYGISRENITSCADTDNGIYPDMIERAVAKLEADGVKFRFEKNSEWQKAGYTDPDED